MITTGGRWENIGISNQQQQPCSGKEVKTASGTGTGTGNFLPIRRQDENLHFLYMHHQMKTSSFQKSSQALSKFLGLW